MLSNANTVTGCRESTSPDHVPTYATRQVEEVKEQPPSQTRHSPVGYISETFYNQLVNNSRYTKQLSYKMEVTIETANKEING